MADIRPRRSALYMPGSNARAQAKTRELDTDAVIFDLEDAVAPDAKSSARATVAASISEGGYGHRELIVRVNGAETPWGDDDVAAAVGWQIDGLLYPKVEQVGQVDRLCRVAGNLPIWVMIETPRGVQNVEAIAAHPAVAVLVMGTSDLVADLRARHTPARENIHYALQRCVLAARAEGKEILDGVHLEFRELAAFESVCRAGRDMGMDGKTLIHPDQIDIANRLFGVSEEERAHASAVMDAWRAAQAEGRGVAVLNGQLVENLHVAAAERTLAIFEALGNR